MAFVQARCENCNGFLKVDETRRAAICPHCGAPYVVQDAINHYYNTSITRISDLHIDVVNMEYLPSWKTQLDAAEAFMVLGEYDKARKRYAELKEVIPQEYRVWWGQIRSITQEFTKTIEDRDILKELHLLYTSAMYFVPANKRDDLER